MGVSPPPGEGPALKVKLPYGNTSVSLCVPDDAVIIRAGDEAPLADEEAAFQRAIRNPVGSVPLAEYLVRGAETCIVTSDKTRPTPNARLLPWILDVLSRADIEHPTVLVGTGTHEGGSPQEIRALVGEEAWRRCRVLVHDARRREDLVLVGHTSSGTPVWVNRHYVSATNRLVVGFIEPHFFAGFSGGPKGVMPAVAGMDTILELHRPELIAHPRTTWGVLDGNPVQEEIAEAALMAGKFFLVNVTLNRQRCLTGIYAGDPIQAHRAGCEHAARSSLVEVEGWFDLVITSNAGYPLDQNLYQAVKGMSAAASICRIGGSILVVAACQAGLPAGGEFERMLLAAEGPRQLLAEILAPGYRRPDSWEAQVMCQILVKHRLMLYSELDPELVRRAFLEPVEDPDGAVASQLQSLGEGARVAVLVDGPLAVPVRRAGE